MQHHFCHNHVITYESEDNPDSSEGDMNSLFGGKSDKKFVGVQKHPEDCHELMYECIYIFKHICMHVYGLPGGSVLKNPPATQRTQV